MALDTKDAGLYTAFISYSHDDRREAERLLRRLETYRLPTPPQNSDSRQLGAIFMDREALAAATELSAAIREALDESRAMVVLCSKSSAQSEWVNREIRTFRELHPNRPIVPVVIEGASEEINDLSVLFPTELLNAYDEPLAADFRRSGDGLRIGFLKLVSALTDTPLSKLLRKDARRRNRRVTAITAASILLSTVMGTLALRAEMAREDAEARRAEVEGMVDFMLNDLKSQLEPVGRLDVLAGVADQTIAYYDARDPKRLDCAAAIRNIHAFHLATNIHLNRDQTELATESAERARGLAALKRTECTENPDFMIADGHSEYWAASPIWRRIAAVELGEAFEQAEYEALLNSLKPYYARYEAAISPLADLPDQQALHAQEAADTAVNFGSVHFYLGEYEQAQSYFSKSINEALKIAMVNGALPNSSSQLSEAKTALFTLANAYGWHSATSERLGQLQQALNSRHQEIEVLQHIAFFFPEATDYLALAQSLQAKMAALRIRTEMRDASLNETDFLNVSNQIARLNETDPTNETWKDLKTKVDLIKDNFSKEYDPSR